MNNQPRFLWPIRLAGTFVLTCCVLGCVSISSAVDGQLELSAIDRDTGQPIAARIHLLNATTKRPVKIPNVPAWGDHFCFSDKVLLKLPLGSYTFTMERGPEYLVRTGHFTLNRYAEDRKTVDMKRFVDMAKDGWYAGDLDLHRSDRDIALLMEAEDLYVAPLVTWTNNKNDWAKGALPKNPLLKLDGNRWVNLLAGQDTRGGNTLGLFNLSKPLALPPSKAVDYPSSLSVATDVRREQGWVDATRPFSWDLPLWVATDKLDSVQVFNRHLQRETVVANEAGGRPRDAIAYGNTDGNGRWSRDIYYHLLNCGLRLPPTAGSGSGIVAPATAQAGTAAAMKAAAGGNFNPPGYDRVYVQVDGELTWDKWWAGLRAGRVVVTNGPLIRPSVEGHPPGHIFQADAGQRIELEIGLTLSTREKISYLEVVKNGTVLHEVRLDMFKEAGGKLPPIEFDRSGWFLVRAVTEEPKTYRYAMTAPYFVEIGDQPRISRASAKFFVDWTAERRAMLEKQLLDPKQREEILNNWQTAEEYWQSLAKRANTE